MAEGDEIDALSPKIRPGPSRRAVPALPARTPWEEVPDEVIDGPQSRVWDEAQNRIHARKGVLAWCFGGNGQALRPDR